MRRFLSLLTLLWLLALLAASPAALANGRLPASNYIAFAPSDPSFIVARVTFGFLLSRDGGKTWEWACEQAVGYSGLEDPAYGIFESGTIVATLATGLRVSRDRGCSWEFAPAPVPEKYFIDVAVRRGAPRSGVAAISGYAGASDEAGAALFLSQIWATNDNGASWTAPGPPLDPTLLVDTLDVAESDPKRLYASATRGSGTDLRGYLLVSEDAGKTWIERTIPLDPDDRGPYIAAVDPKNADRLYVRTAVAPDKGARLLVTSDAGKTWEQKLKGTGPLTGFALSEGGERIWVGGTRDGLHTASTADMVFTKKSQIQVQCLGVQGKSLWACSSEASGFVLGVSKDDGATFESRLHLAEIRGPLTCDPTTSTGKLCTAAWSKQKVELGIESNSGPLVLDAGWVPNPGPPSPTPVCKCGVVGGAPVGLGAVLLGAATALFVLRAGRRRR